MKKNVMIFLGVLLLLCGCAGEKNPCSWCSNVPTKQYVSETGVKSFVCKECRKKCRFCTDKAEKHYANEAGIETFVCLQCYNDVTKKDDGKAEKDISIINSLGEWDLPPLRENLQIRVIVGNVDGQNKTFTLGYTYFDESEDNQDATSVEDKLYKEELTLGYSERDVEGRKMLVSEKFEIPDITDVYLAADEKGNLYASYGAEAGFTTENICFKVQ